MVSPSCKLPRAEAPPGTTPDERSVYGAGPGVKTQSQKPSSVFDPSPKFPTIATSSAIESAAHKATRGALRMRFRADSRASASLPGAYRLGMSESRRVCGCQMRLRVVLLGAFARIARARSFNRATAIDLFARICCDRMHRRVSPGIRRPPTIRRSGPSMNDGHESYGL